MTKKINILYLTEGRKVAGGEKVTQGLLENVKEPPFRKYLANIYNPKGGRNVFREKLIAKGHVVISLGMRGLYDISCIPTLIKICRENEVHLIHTGSPRTDLVGLLVAKVLGVPIVSTLHNSYTKTLKDKIYQVVQLRILYRFFGRVITVSEASRKFLTKNGVSSKRIKVICNGISPKITKIDISQIHLMTDPGRRKSLIIFVGSLIPKKGISYLINAMAQVIKKFTNVELLIVGDGSELRRLVNQTKELGIEDFIRFTGYVDDPSKYINLANFLVLPSISEEFGLVLLEAMRGSKAVVATKVGGIPEVVKHDETGILVEPKSSDRLARAMLKLLQDPKKCDYMGRRGRERLLQRFTLKQMVRGVESVYFNVLRASSN